MNLSTLQFIATTLVSGLLVVASAQAKPPKNAEDHPMISRYEGSEILDYRQSAYDEFHMMVKKATSHGGLAKNMGSTKTVEGKYTRITYQAPPERSTLEVFRNYEQELTRHGFKELYRCVNKACGGRDFNQAVSNGTYFGGDEADQRYLAARIERSQGDVYVAVYAVKHRSGAEHLNNRIRVQLDILESAPMDTGMVKIDPKKLASDIDSEGHVAIYSIQFETDSAKLKPSSDPTLAIIAEMLTQQPKLTLLIVGHTDNKGGLKHNMDLSRRRAQAVVKVLISKHRVSGKRLIGEGVGYLAPIASNKSEAGRAKNRRVELVEN